MHCLFSAIFRITEHFLGRFHTIREHLRRIGDLHDDGGQGFCSLASQPENRVFSSYKTMVVGLQNLSGVPKKDFVSFCKHHRWWNRALSNLARHRYFPGGLSKSCNIV